MKKLLSTFALATLVLSACSTNTDEPKQVADSPVPEEFVPMDEALIYEALAGSYTTALVDVDTGEELGSAFMSEGGDYTYINANAQLPLLEEGYFYEGWVVRNEPLSVVSTGAFTYQEYGEGVYDFDNEIELEGDYTDHPKYIITLEPDDGDPAPAGHVADGTLTAL